MILEILYITLIIFLIVIWTLLSIALVKFIRILNVLEEWVDIYQKIKQVMAIYEQIPTMLLEKAKDFVFWFFSDKK